MSTNSNTSKFEHALAYVIVVLAVVAMVLSYTHSFPTIKAAAAGLDSAAPYTRYARPVRPACDTSTVFEALDTSKGGNTYSEWVLYVGDESCHAPTKRLVATATASPVPSTSTSVPTQTSTNTPIVTATPTLVVTITSTPIITTTASPTQAPTNTPVVTPTVVVTSTPNPTDTPMPTETDKPHCNKGEGNGGEGCDPGNHPEKGNNDED